MAAWRHERGGVGSKAVLRFGHTDRQLPISRRFPCGELMQHAWFSDCGGGAVDARCNDVPLVEQRFIIVINRCELRGIAVG